MPLKTWLIKLLLLGLLFHCKSTPPEKPAEKKPVKPKPTSGWIDQHTYVRSGYAGLDGVGRVKASEKKKIACERARRAAVNNAFFLATGVPITQDITGPDRYASPYSKSLIMLFNNAKTEKQIFDKKRKICEVVLKVQYKNLKQIVLKERARHRKK